MDADELEELELTNAQGEELGEIEEVLIDPNTGRIAYLLVEHGGFLGMGEDVFAVPWGVARYVSENDELVLDISEERLKNAPRFDRKDRSPLGEREWAMSVHSFYGATPYWRDRPGDDLVHDAGPVGPADQIDVLYGTKIHQRADKERVQIITLLHKVGEPIAENRLTVFACVPVPLAKHPDRLRHGLTFVVGAARVRQDFLQRREGVRPHPGEHPRQVLDAPIVTGVIHNKSDQGTNGIGRAQLTERPPCMDRRPGADVNFRVGVVELWVRRDRDQVGNMLLAEPQRGVIQPLLRDPET